MELYQQIVNILVQIELFIWHLIIKIKDFIFSAIYMILMFPFAILFALAMGYADGQIGKNKDNK